MPQSIITNKFQIKYQAKNMTSPINNSRLCEQTQEKYLNRGFRIWNNQKQILKQLRSKKQALNIFENLERYL